MNLTTPALMIQATGSNAGKSTIVAGLARALVRRGLKVAPFKPQNMSNNAAVAVDGGEIGRAQAVQARAAKLPPSVHMNPVLLKPETDTGAQVIVQGKRGGTLRAKNFLEKKAALAAGGAGELSRCWPTRLTSFSSKAPGSPAEINLRAGDIANMGFAAAANIPVVLVGDIDRGGVIASLAGTHLVLEPDERARIHGFIVNKFRGDPSPVRRDGLTAITRLTGCAVHRRGAMVAAGCLPAGRRCRRSRSHPCLVIDADHRRAGAGTDRQFRRSRSAWHGARREAGLHQAGRAGSRATPTSSSFPVASPPSAIWPSCVRRAGTSISRRMCAAVATCLACAAAIRCSAKPSPIPMASMDCAPARLKGSGLLDIANAHERRQVHHADHRHALRDGGGDRRLRDSSRSQRGWRLRAAAADDRWTT